MSEFFTYFRNNQWEILNQLGEHFRLTIISVFLASVTGIGTGVAISWYRKASGFVLALVNSLQTIPSLALLGFLIPLLGIGVVPAILALFLYALLPIVRNTYTGILQVDPVLRQSAESLGMTRWQILTRVELPLAFPVIVAGIRTASVINVGVATLCALVAAGGLGESIFGGISLNSTNMILAGAIPASLLALTMDGLFGLAQKYSTRYPRIIAAGFSLLLVVTLWLLLPEKQTGKLVAGFNSEFIQRADGYTGLNKTYRLPAEIRELEIGLMYKALANGDVDFIDGFSTDGRILTYDLKMLEDDKSYFPPYYAAPLVNNQTLEKYPQLRGTLNRLSGKLTNKVMADLNKQVDLEKKDPADVAENFLLSLGISGGKATGREGARLVIGSKAFTESYLLAHIFSQLITAETGLSTELKTGFGGTKLIFDALRTGEIDIYPEYSGTGLLVILQPGKNVLDSLGSDRQAVSHFVREKFREKYQLIWLDELGFNNTFALMMRRKQAEALGIESISDLAEYLNK